MISETMPLNENSSRDLWDLWGCLSTCRLYSDEYERALAHSFMQVVKQAIKDAEERESKLPF